MGGYGPISLSGVLPYLSALDYAGFLEHRAGKSTKFAADYAELVDGFESATGKRIELPRLAHNDQIAIFVDAGAGNRHSLTQLSSGEQEALGLMYLVRRLSSRGGILLIDEPELHLHPTLQRTIVAVLERASGRSQLWLSMHSPALITALRWMRSWPFIRHPIGRTSLSVCRFRPIAWPFSLNSVCRPALGSRAIFSSSSRVRRMNVTYEVAAIAPVKGTRTCGW